jgi:hypothetical protein
MPEEETIDQAPKAKQDIRFPKTIPTIRPDETPGAGDLKKTYNFSQDPAMMDIVTRDLYFRLRNQAIVAGDKKLMPGGLMTQEEVNKRLAVKPVDGKAEEEMKQLGTNTVNEPKASGSG